MSYNFSEFNRNALILIFAVICICTAVSIAGISPGWPENFSFSAVQVAPFMILAFFAYMSEKYPGLRIITTIWLFAVILITAAASFGIGAISVMPPEIFSETAQAADEIPLQAGDINLDTAFKIFFMFIAVSAASLLSLAGQLRRFRVFLSRRIPLDPDSFVHKTALTALLALILIPPVPLLATGMPPYLSPVFLEISNSAEMIADAVSFDIFSLFWIIIASFVIAGLYIVRSCRDVLKRLGLVKPSKKELFLAVITGLALVGVFFVLDHAITAVWELFGWQVTDEEAVNTLFAAYMTPVAALVAAVSAGFGEEIAVRGLLQPRFGVLLPSLLFASLHAFQYSWDGVLSVFIAGIIFAVIRDRYNTTFSAVTHSVYDMILFYALIYGIGI